MYFASLCLVCSRPGACELRYLARSDRITCACMRLVYFKGTSCHHAVRTYAFLGSGECCGPLRIARMTETLQSVVQDFG